MRTYVSTMGFHETRVTRPVLRTGLDDGDRVVLLRPDTESDPDRGQEAVAYVEDMLHEIAPGSTVTVESIDHESFETAVLQCSDVLRAAQGTLIVNFGGGARELFLPLTIAAVVHAREIDTAIQYTDIGQDVRDWEVPSLGADVSEEAVETLRAVAEFGPEVFMPELHDHIEKSESTASRHVTQLEAENLVETEKHGKRKLVRVTLGGELHLRRDS